MTVKELRDCLNRVPRAYDQLQIGIHIDVFSDADDTVGCEEFRSLVLPVRHFKADKQADPDVKDHLFFGSIYECAKRIALPGESCVLKLDED